MKKNLRSVRPSLRLTPYAWAKLLRWRDLGTTEVGGFGISAKEDLLLIEDIQLVRQVCTSVTVKFEDDSVADYFDAQVDAGTSPQRCGRIWIHTHPGDCPKPSWVDEQTFARCFGGADWSVMFILAQGGQTYARLRFNTGPGGELELPVVVDYSREFTGSSWEAWDQEYQQQVSCELPRWQLPWRRRRDGVGHGDSSEHEQRSLIDEFLLPDDFVLDAMEDGPWLDADPYHSFLETADDPQTRSCHP